MIIYCTAAIWSWHLKARKDSAHLAILCCVSNPPVQATTTLPVDTTVRTLLGLCTAATTLVLCPWAQRLPAAYSNSNIVLHKEKWASLCVINTAPLALCWPCTPSTGVIQAGSCLTCIAVSMHISEVCWYAGICIIRSLMSQQR